MKVLKSRFYLQSAGMSTLSYLLRRVSRPLFDKSVRNWGWSR